MSMVVSHFRCVKGTKCELDGSALCESLRELRTDDTDTWAWGGNFRFLQDAIGRLEREYGLDRFATVEESALPTHTPTQFAQEILLKFFRADTTELAETKILAMFPEDRLAVEAALTELCNNNLLAVAQLGRAGKSYVVTTTGQTLCLSCRDR